MNFKGVIRSLNKELGGLEHDKQKIEKQMAHIRSAIQALSDTAQRSAKKTVRKTVVKKGKYKRTKAQREKMSQASKKAWAARRAKKAQPS